VTIVEGDEENLKLTFPGDFARAEQILASRSAPDPRTAPDLQNAPDLQTAPDPRTVSDPRTAPERTD
jgi:hypothetical protein